MRSRFESWRQRHMWVEFVVGSLPCSERFFSGYSGFPLSLKTNIFKFRFDLHGHVSTSSYELLSDPWVNKLQFKQITITILLLVKCQHISLCPMQREREIIMLFVA